LKIGDKIEYVAEKKCETEEVAKNWDTMDPRLKAVISKEQCSPEKGMKGRVMGCSDGEIALEMSEGYNTGVSCARFHGDPANPNPDFLCGKEKKKTPFNLWSVQCGAIKKSK